MIWISHPLRAWLAHVDPPVKWTLGLAAAGTGLTAASLHELSANFIPWLNMALITIGSTAILLYQRKHSVDREERRKDIEAGVIEGHIEQSPILIQMTGRVDDLHERLRAVVAQRDKLWKLHDDLLARAAQLSEQVQELSTRLDRCGCRYPNPDGTARCADRPPTPVDAGPEIVHGQTD